MDDRQEFPKRLKWILLSLRHQKGFGFLLLFDTLMIALAIEATANNTNLVVTTGKFGLYLILGAAAVEYFLETREKRIAESSDL